MNTVIEEQQETWPLTATLARDYIDFAIEHNIPTSELLEEPFCRRILKQALWDSEFFSQVFMSESFDDPMTWQNDILWRLIDDDTIPYLAICMWRGGGKTTSVIAKLVKSICYRLERFIMVVGKSHDYAAQITQSIKAELMTNLRIRKIFGSVKQRSAAELKGSGDPNDGMDYSFSIRGWFACDPETAEPFCFVLPKGCKQQVRGMNVRIGGRMQRITLMFIDDLESDKELGNGDLRRETRIWLNGSLLPCVPSKEPSARTNRWSISKHDAMWRPPWRIIYTDTLKHEDSQMAHILESSRWRKKVLPQCEVRKDADGKSVLYSLATERVSHEQVRAKYRLMREEDTEDEFFKEYMCLSTNPIHAIWTREVFQEIRYVDAKLQLNRRNDVTRFIVCDPARTANMTSCPTAALAFAKDIKEPKLYVRRELNARMQINEIPAQVLELAHETNTRIVAVEVDGGDDWIRDAFFNEAAKRGWAIRFIFINAPRQARGQYGTGEESRKRRDATGMGRYYKNREVAHDVSIKDGPLEAGLLNMPNPRRWDSIDCLGHVPRVLNQLGIYDEPNMDSDRAQFDDEDDWDEIGEKIRRASRASQNLEVPDLAGMFGYQDSMRATDVSWGNHGIRREFAKV